jgi:hypothetical protein
MFGVQIFREHLAEFTVVIDQQNLRLARLS